uniref:Nectin cell adhesion molecule 2 n=1 Tax=Ursus americanus TaxID=9643 RepID=A0A452SDR3_URSAM
MLWEPLRSLPPRLLPDSTVGYILPHCLHGFLCRAQDVQVRVPPEVRGYLGGTVQLPCHLLPPGPEVRVSQVTWLHVDAAGTSKSVAAFHPSYGPSFRGPKPGEERLSFVTAGQSTGTRQGTEIELRDATLALRGLTVEDEGNYTCEFATFPSGTSRGVTWLRAIAQPQNHAETQEVTLSLEPMPVARCVSEGGRPPARISWVSSLDGEGRQSQMSGPVPGTVTVTSRYTLVPLSRVDGVKVTCKVEHESFEEPILLPVTLSVRYPPEVSISGYDDNWYLGRGEATLSCDVRSKPEPTGYDWSTTAGVFPASAVAQGPQLIIHSVDKLVNTTFICTVTNAVGTGRAEQVVLVRDTPRASPRDVGPVVWGAVGGTLLVLLLLAGGSLAFILLRVRRRRKSPGGGGGGGGDSSGGGPYDPKTQVFGNGGPVFWTPTAPGPLKPDGKDEEDEEDEEEKAEEGLMLPPPKALEDDMESQLDGSLISRRAIYV